MPMDPKGGERESMGEVVCVHAHRPSTKAKAQAERERTEGKIKGVAREKERKFQNSR